METPDRAISTSIWPENSLKVSSDLEDKNAKTCATCLAGSILPCTCACSNDDMGFVVEELTLKNYEQSKLSIIGSFDRMEGMESRKGHRKNLYNLASGSGNGNMHGDALSKQPFTTDGGDDAGTTKRPEFQVQKRPVSRKLNKTCLSENLNNADRGAASDYVMHRREKSAKSSTISGFTQFFVKNALVEKRIACRNSEACDGVGATASRQNEGKENCANVISVKCIPETDYLPSHNVHEQYPITQIMFQDGINLREWLRPGFRKVNKAESLHIFMQIVKLVDMAHSQQIALQDITPSCFELLPSNHVKYVGSLTSRESANSSTGAGLPYLEHHLSRKRSMEQGADAYNGVYSKHQKLDGNLKFALEHTQSVAAPDLKWKRAGTVGIEMQDSGNPLRHEYNSNSELNVQNRSRSSCAPYTSQQKLPWSDIQLENKWYASPEELHGSGLTISSNIYGLGVLLFELLCCFESLEGHAAAMSDLRHRILPPNFLSENPKETGFCLWILHPEPSSRPTTREILQSEIIRGSRELPVSNQLAAPADEDDTESELLLHFLAIVKDERQKKATRLIEDINYLEADLEEVSKRHISKTGGIFGRSHKAFFEAREPGFADKEYVDLGLMSDYLSNKNESRLTRNRSQLESAYFSVRSQMQLQDTNSTARVDKDLIRNRDGWNSVQIENEDVLPNQIPNDRMGVFFDGLCKYARYSKFEQRAVLRNGDLLNSANVIRSLNFDRDEDYFAAAGVSKKIKIFDFHALLNESVDIHYPVIEMTNKSKLSCVCWNNYIKNYLASTDYDGDVQLWDVSTGQVFSQYMEHEKRAWSADFSQVDPKKLASGSDDGSVKLWSINERKSISTIRSIANICCVQFSSHSTNLLAFGSADYKTYCYDLRNTRIPWCTLAGHGKAVSYVKFLDAGTLISASTDNTLKLWDLNKTSSSGLSTSACSLTFTGHTNEKNFVGLSVSDGYIACGSETNEVYAYQRSLPVPITSYKFGSVDPISGQETGDDNGQFVSSVCWRGKSNMVVTANSTGSIKLLELV